MGPLPTSSFGDMLSSVFAGLKNKDPDVQLCSALELRRYVADAGGSSDDIDGRVTELICSQNGTDNRGGLLAIDHLIDGECNSIIQSSHNLLRFYHSVKQLLPNRDAALILTVSKTLGRILAVGVSAFSESFMEEQVIAAAALATASHPSSSKHNALGMVRYSGVLILRQLALNLPVYFIAHLPAVLEGAILVPLRDPMLLVREAATELLASCLEIGQQRWKRFRALSSNGPLEYLPQILQDAQTGLKSDQPEVIHGSLLTFRALFLHAGMSLHSLTVRSSSSQFMHYTFRDTVDAILAHRAHRDPAVRRMVISMIPTFASYNVSAFKEFFLREAMAHLFSLFENGPEGDYALVAIGHTATTVGCDMKPFLKPIMNHITARLKEAAAQAMAANGTGSSRKSGPDPLLAAVGLLATAVGPALTIFLPDDLHLLFVAGLTKDLRVCLNVLARTIPPLLARVQDCLLDLLSHILSGTPYIRLDPQSQPQGESVKPNNTSTSINWEYVYGKQVARQWASKELLTLALNTLGTFDFSGHILTEFVCTNALPYVEDDAPEVRRAAALTCCRLLSGAPPSSSHSYGYAPIHSYSGHGEDGYEYAYGGEDDDSMMRMNMEMVGGASRGGMTTMGGAISVARSLGVGDDWAGGDIGKRCVGAVEYQMSGHAVGIVSEVVWSLLTVGIADPDPTAEHVHRLFMALNDEVFENRVAAATLIGRIARRNPAYVMPSLRKTFMELLVELKHSTVALKHEESTRLFTALVAAPPRNVSPSMITCLGTLVSVSGEDARGYLPELMPVLVAGLADASPARREAALSALGRVCSSTGYVITPIVDYPGLLLLLGRILRQDARDGKRAYAEVVKREVVKVMGVLGAIDPYRMKTKSEDENGSETSMVAITKVTPTSSTFVTSTGTSPDDYFQTVVISALLRLLNDPASSGHHHAVVKAIVFIFKTQGFKSNGNLPLILPAFTAVTRAALPQMQESYLQHLTVLICIIKQHVRDHADEVFRLVAELWTEPILQTTIIVLITAVGRALAAELQPFLPTILPLLLEVFAVEGELSEKQMEKQMKVLDTFQTFGANIEKYLHSVIPIIMRAAESAYGDVALRKRAILTIHKLLSAIDDISDQASRIMHPLMRILDCGINELHVAVLDALCSLIVQLSSHFLMFVPTINKCLVRHRITHPAYNRALAALLNGECLRTEPNAFIYMTNDNQAADLTPMEGAKLTVNQIHLKQMWDTAQINTEQDWIDWIDQLGVEFIKESASHALRACINLAEPQSPLAKELFNLAFLSCWSELHEQYQDHLVRSIEIALTSPITSWEVIRRLLDLCEFMEHEERPLPIDHSTLGECSMKSLAYPKALYYKELEFSSSASLAILESLISINMRLQQYDAAWSALLLAREQYNEALVVYDKKMEADPNNPEIQMGRMRCLHALGEWEQLATQVEDRWLLAEHEDQRAIAPMGAAAAWSLSEWDSMESYIQMMRSDSADQFFYRAILSVHHNQIPEALTHISKARELLHPQLITFGSPGYARSYNVMVRAQMLSELEEVIQYKQYADQPERQQMMRNTWMKRLQGCQPDVEVWQRILQIRTLIIHPEDDPIAFIKFANLCRKSDRMGLAEKTIISLLTPYMHPHLREYHCIMAPPNVVYTQLKLMWARGAREHTLAELRQFTVSLARDLQAESSYHAQQAGLPEQRFNELKKLLARCYFKQGEWQVALNENWYRDDDGLKDVLHSYLLATNFDEGWYKAWHTWAMANFEVVSRIDAQAEGRVRDISGERLASHVVQSIECFFRSINLRNEDALQDTLRLLTLWFKYGAHEEITHAIACGFSMVKIDTWLPVIPQIIARIQTPHASIRQNIKNLLIEVGKNHPQALIYPLTVGSKSPSESRRSAALAIMDRMREHSPTIVEQARIVSRELIRVAILWHEMWHEGLEEASRLYYTVRNPAGILGVLEPLHEMLEAGPQTGRESSFNQVFGNDLCSAREACRRYHQFGETRELENAWGIYSAVFQKIEKQLPQLTALDLQYVSPELLNIRNLDLAVPGTYQSGREVIHIANFAPRLTVIPSKQRPRRMSLKGSDGMHYQYILKGHEDLRQDERVMQLFSLINTLLAVDTNSFRRHLNIQRYPVIPLAPNAGLIGVIQQSDTLHELVRDYRHSAKFPLNMENRLILEMAPNYENLPLLQKIQVFKHALENTSNSEHWVDRRTSYTRSLAVNSMVGHILGLGDRHPSNLMLERKTGKVVHVDFGDCFEVAMHRKKFPEKVPFRLTRMLTHAMEFTGIEGSFRKTCEISMQVLRDNQESLLAVLEAFVYDPLINWRLVQAEIDVRSDDDTTAYRSMEYGWVTARPQRLTQSLRTNENDIFSGTLQKLENWEKLTALTEAGWNAGVQELCDKQALLVYNRIQHKLAGRDFKVDIALPVEDQVAELIHQAMSLENLCQCYAGWCAYCLDCGDSKQASPRFFTFSTVNGS
ncbi:Serine/threonine-protein kinase TOR [Mycena venus]|uniref:Serine/threonine-protein kinase TOR n=1 Tax=Mycena venus TaxID=2733690 RepID=A0A8H6X564_9AGAR|nr:Serine/threonine-protein kinase TOR [Mycena venus]